MKIIVDTNVLISAILRDRDPELVIQFIVDHPDFEWVASPEILAEYQAVLARPKFRLPQEIQDAWTALLTAAIAPIEVNVTVDFSTDPKDAMFLSCAIASDADFIITGDTDLLNADLAIKTSVVNVSTFKTAFYEAQEDCQYIADRPLPISPSRDRPPTAHPKSDRDSEQTTPSHLRRFNLSNALLPLRKSRLSFALRTIGGKFQHNWSDFDESAPEIAGYWRHPVLVSGPRSL